MVYMLPKARYPEVPLEEQAFIDLLQLHGQSFDGLNVSKICTANYYSVVELNNGTQGAAINYLNVHGPFHTEHDYESFDNERLSISRDDKLLRVSILEKGGLGFADLSLKIAVLNALSSQFYSCEKLAERNLEFHEGFPNVTHYFEQGDSIAMIGCIGNFINSQLGGLAKIRRVFFSDFECSCAYRPHVESFIEKHFQSPSIVHLTDVRDNRMIIESSEVVIVSADCLCTRTFDELLAWSADARHVLIVGWSFALNPAYLFDRGVQLVTVALPQADIVDRTIEHVQSNGISWEYPYLNYFRRGFLSYRK